MVFALFILVIAGCVAILGTSQRAANPNINWCHNIGSMVRRHRI
jgi:hypothetical protein